MSERVYIALDLETTGLNPQSDAIIEIGAVCFACRYSAGHMRFHRREHFVSFVNPNRKIPLRIQQLTGIRNADVEKAPTLEQIIPELLAFIPRNTAAVVAHNADFDFGFLNAAGINFHRPTQDTFELASIFLPGMSSYGLGELCRALEISLPDAHRALDDAEATANLFCRILQRMQATPRTVYDILAACGQDAKWSPLLLWEQLYDSNGEFDDGELGDGELGDGELGDGKLDGQSSGADTPVVADGNDLTDTPDTDTHDTVTHDTVTHEKTDEDTHEYGHSAEPAAHAPGTAAAIPADMIDDIFANDGAFARVLGTGYEYRQGQMDMALRVMHALNIGDHLIIEAGTGTGKSMAYLAPAALWCGRNDTRVVVATNTIALQDQILDNDLPTLSKLLVELGVPSIRVAALKGRGNYLCMRRLHSWYNNRTLSITELRVLARILIWLPDTESGDIEELFMPSTAEKLIWTHICSDAKTCHPGRCGPTPGAAEIVGVPIRDFFLVARRMAEAAHILVVNHALLLADIAADGRLLPAYANVIIDEAHRLEDAATEQLSHRVIWRIVFDQLGRMEKRGDLAESIVRALSGQGPDAGAVEPAHVHSRLKRLAKESRGARKRLQAFAGQLLTFFQNQERLRTDLQFMQRIALDNGMRSQPMWVEIELEWDAASQALRAVLNSLADLRERLEAMRWWQAEPFATYYTDIQSLEDFIQDLVAWVDRIIFEPPTLSESTTVAWVEVNDAHNDATLVAAPLHVHELIEKELIHARRSIIFTGATLRTGSGFTFIRDRLGLWDVTASTVESPFDYQKNALLYLPADLPEPNHGAFQQSIEQAIIRAARATGGATLALFTSYAQLRATADAIRAPLDREGITVLQHGMSSRRRILREYRNTERAVLLGTRSFWEGIDLPGDELRCLLIVRLPFAVPTDPLVAARSTEFENPFRDYTLPDAIIRFRQGFGRLIRRATDHGVVVVLDSRIWRKEYGQAFLESLPACTVRHAPLANLDTEIRQWLHR